MLLQGEAAFRRATASAHVQAVAAQVTRVAAVDSGSARSPRVSFSVAVCAAYVVARIESPSANAPPHPSARSILSLFVGLSLLFATVRSNPTSYAGEVQRVRPIALLPWRLQLANSFIAVLPEYNNPDLNVDADSLVDFISSNFPAANFSDLGGVGEAAQGLSVASPPRLGVALPLPPSPRPPRPRPGRLVLPRHLRAAALFRRAPLLR